MTEMQELSDYFQTVLKEKKAELAKVKKQLAIAVKALEIYADKANWDNHFTIETNDCEFDIISFIEGIDKDGEFYAERALQQIKELEKCGNIK